jgi:CubicO group peptidase (beta-lactamase class C family)
MNKLNFRIIIYLSLLLWFALPSVAQNELGEVNGRRAQAINDVFRNFNRAEAPGYAVGIVKNGKLVFARGFGSANLDYNILISKQTVFSVASLSKQFTAACIGILIRRGQLSLEDELAESFPEAAKYGASIRIKHLVYMTSGLKEYYRLPRPRGRSWELDYFTVQDAIAASLNESELDFQPGTKWAYSNVNYMLLAEIVGKASKMSFAEFARRNIFEPLGMRNTHFNDDVTRVVRLRAVGYNLREGGGFHKHDRISPHYGGSGLHTTIEDLFVWNESFYTHALGGAELTKLLESAMRFEHPKTNDAFGLVWGEYRGLRNLWYEGGDLGFSSYMARFPAEQFTVIVLSNLGSGDARGYAHKILDLFIESKNRRQK